LWYISRIMPRAFLLRGALSIALMLAVLCALASPKDKEAAPRFNADTTTG
jgi:hypothetical protein